MPNFVTFKFSHYLVLLLVWLKLNIVLSEIKVYKNTDAENVVQNISFFEMAIGTEVPNDGIVAYIVSAEPEDACDTIKPPPKDPFHAYSNEIQRNWFVLVDRDNCLIDKKLKNVEDAGYNGVIIYNAKLVNNFKAPEPEPQNPVVDFPVLLVTHIDGRQIKTFYTYEKGYFVRVSNNTPLIVKAYLWPLLVGIGVLIGIILFGIFKIITHRYNQRQKRKKAAKMITKVVI